MLLVNDAPWLSVTLYVTSYLPATSVLTSFFSTTILVVKLPSSASSAVTPAIGSNVSPTVIVLSVAWITGASFNTSIFGLTVTIIVFLHVAPWLSVTLYVTSYLPATSVLTSFFSTTILVVKLPSSASSAVISAIGSNVSPTVIVLSVALITGAELIGVQFISQVAL